MVVKIFLQGGEHKVFSHQLHKLIENLGLKSRDNFSLYNHEQGWQKTGQY
jgi:hypothetical protein